MHPEHTNAFSMQITVPHSVFGACQYFLPIEIKDWLFSYGISDYSFVGGSVWGNGYTDGVTNKESVYMIRNIHESDAIALQIKFPKCKVHLCKYLAV